MLLFQYEEQRVLEMLESLVGATRHGDTFALATRRLLLDEALDIVIINVVYISSALLYVPIVRQDPAKYIQCLHAATDLCRKVSPYFILPTQ